MAGGRIQDRVALITGGGTGIGRASSELVAREGASVMVSGLYADQLQDVVDAIQHGGGCAACLAGNVRSADDARKIGEATVERFGHLDILFNNAGIEYIGPIQDTPEEKWDLVLDTNLKAIYQVSRFVIPHMIEQHRGVIINTASQLAFVAAPNFAAYCASKDGVVNLTRAMALDLARHNIRVTRCAPEPSRRPC